ncbi:MAG: 3-dehydroquinate synthase [candidate division Zixibacteria bacterium]|nr:3-dehydroquinate synthase [candidate division Zixibacteria bacterium]
MKPSRIKPTIIGRTPSQRVPIFIGAGNLERLGRLIVPERDGQPLAMVTDRVVDGLFGNRAAAVLRDAGWKVERTVLPGGEKVKSQQTILKLHALWLQRGYDRGTPVVALGGGTIGDAVGFAAATYLRGLPLWQVPTSIVGQVDAAIGGKVGINHARGKNLIGCFYQPTGVVIDPLLLQTLPPRERKAGLAEVVKYGVIADPVLFGLCERRLHDWLSRRQTIDDKVIQRCIRIKLRVVAADERDFGLRRILNFGHTLGHAFERWGGYRRLRHGEAVTLGMVGAAWMAHRRRIFPDGDYRRLLSLCARLHPQAKITGWRAEMIVSFLKVDKKRSGGVNVWVLPRRIGLVTMARDASDREIKGALRFVGAWMSVANDE